MKALGAAGITDTGTADDDFVMSLADIGNGCFLSNSGVEGPTLLERASIRGMCSIRDSLIGCASSIRKLVVGDDSLVEIGIPSTFKDQP